jgi:hypothetical protein
MGFRITCPNQGAASRVHQAISKYHRENVEVAVDSVAAESFLSLISEQGEGRVAIIGEKPVREWLKYGYQRIAKKCPYRMFGLFRCRAEKCQHYVVDSGVGDCATNWVAILAVTERREALARHQQILQMQQQKQQTPEKTS